MKLSSGGGEGKVASYWIQELVKELRETSSRSDPAIDSTDQGEADAIGATPSSVRILGQDRKHSERVHGAICVAKLKSTTV